MPRLKNYTFEKQNKAKQYDDKQSELKIFFLGINAKYKTDSYGTNNYAQN